MIYLGILFLLSLLILVHEGGHFAAAKLVGIPVASFSVGLGPRLWRWRWGWTEYSIRALPLGGFVVPAVDEDGFRAIPWRRRLVFFLGGPLANLAMTIPLFSALNGLRHGFSFYHLAVAPFGQAIAAVLRFLELLPEVFSGPASLSGVVGLVVEGGRFAQAGMAIEFAISLSISLAVLNLLPIPVLDGGQIVMNSLEEIFPRLIRLRVPLTLLGVLVLAGIMIYANLHDVFRYWG